MAKERAHALRVQGRKFQMTEYFLSGSLCHSDMVLMFSAPYPGEITGFFSVSAPLWFQLIFYHRRGGKRGMPRSCWLQRNRESEIF